ncbi:hypothetical protein JOM56_012847 [Amanita muscaria]
MKSAVSTFPLVVRLHNHDLAHVLVGSAGHVVTLTRSRQGRFVLEPTKADADDRACIPWEVFQKVLVDPGEKDSDADRVGKASYRESGIG